MSSDMHTTFINYYEYLNVARDTSLSELQKAFEQLVTGTQAQLNNPLTMQAALSIHNTIEPGIREHLLSSPEARAVYDQQLADIQEKQATRSELADNEGLDDVLSYPFFFNPFDGYDTEEPAFTLRQIAQKLDSEWSQATAWITDTSDTTHVFIGFLIHVAERSHLATRIGQIIDAVAPKQKVSMHANEGLERCITILDPQIERPSVGIYTAQFDGKTFDAGEFIADLPAETEMTLEHEGTRGCVFGTIESRTDWVRFRNGQSQQAFLLMPPGTEPVIGTTKETLPLLLQVSKLERNTEHKADIVVHMNNFAPPRELPIRLLVRIPPLPPRVSIFPPATEQRPLHVKTVRRGELISTVVVIQNAGDDHLLPLTGRISTQEPGVSAAPERFHANEQITLKIDTSNRPFGKTYNIVFNIDYGLTAQVIGPTALYLHGEILPTLWQSILREKEFGERLIAGIVSGIGSSLLGLLLGFWLASHTESSFSLFVIVPALFIYLTRLSTQTFVAHIHRTGNLTMHLTQVSNWVLWYIPLICAFLVTIICFLVPDIGFVPFFGAIIGFFVGSIPGFVLDKARASKASNSF